MRTLLILWYLCILFLMTFLVGSAVTLAPGLQSFQREILGVSAVLTVGFAAMSLAFMWLGVPRIDWLPRNLLWFAIASTLIVIIFIIGR